MGAAIKADELLAYLFEEQGHDLYAPLSRWIASSRAFKTFSSEYRTKIRKKIRVTRSGPALEDLTAELAVAYELLQQKRFSVIYEPYGSEAGRGPDFAVGFKSVTFNVEVTRIQSDNLQPDGQSPGFDSQQVDGRLIDTVCDKLGQMRSGMSNVLIVVADGRFWPPSISSGRWPT